MTGRRAYDAECHRVDRLVLERAEQSLLWAGNNACNAPALIPALEVHAQHADTFTLIMGAAMLRYMASLLAFGLTAARRFGIQVIHQSAVSLAALLGSVLWIADRGLEGAALTTLLTFAVDLVIVIAINLWSVAKLHTASAQR